MKILVIKINFNKKINLIKYDFDLKKIDSFQKINYNKIDKIWKFFEKWNLFEKTHMFQKKAFFEKR